jgi:GNAT superfamily N-acetyltransferase
VDIEVTQLADEHADGLYAMLVAAGWPQTADDLAGGQRGSYEVYVALSGARVVGMLEGSFHENVDCGLPGHAPPQSCVRTMVVARSERRKGVGAALLRRFAADAAAAGRTLVMVWPDPRYPADRLAFFAANGFTPTPGGQVLGAAVETVLDKTSH